MANNDPAIWRVKQINEVSEQQREHGRRLVFGDHPTPDERIAHFLINALGDAVPTLDDLPDEALRDTLTRACRSLLRVRSCTLGDACMRSQRTAI